MSGPVILFDGVCNLCSGWVRRVIAADPGRSFRFAALQSTAGARLLKDSGMPEDSVSTIVLIEDGRAFTRSTAALRIARRLAGPWPLLYPLLLVPRPLRDLVYDWVARNRYRWFGRMEACMIPGPETRDRFLA